MEGSIHIQVAGIEIRKGHALVYTPSAIVLGSGVKTGLGTGGYQTDKRCWGICLHFMWLYSFLPKHNAQSLQYFCNKVL